MPAYDDAVERAAQAAMRTLRAVVRDQETLQIKRGRALRECVEAGWTVADLSRELDVTRGTIYRWMTAGAHDGD